MDYGRHYEALIARARTRSIDGYVERHHVLPRCLGGGNEPENIVRLTPEEHFVAHQLLLKIHDRDYRLVFAALSLTRGRSGGNKRYGWLRRRFAVAMSAVWLGKKRKPFSDEHRAKIAAVQIGRARGPHSDEHKAKLSAAHTGKKLSAEHIEKLAATKRGKKQSAETIAKRVASNTGKTREFSEEHKRAIGAAQLGSIRGDYQKRTCPHCGKNGGGGSMSRWHFDNCRRAA